MKSAILSYMQTYIKKFLIHLLVGILILGLVKIWSEFDTSGFVTIVVLATYYIAAPLYLVYIVLDLIRNIYKAVKSKHQHEVKNITASSYVKSFIIKSSIIGVLFIGTLFMIPKLSGTGSIISILLIGVFVVLPFYFIYSLVLFIKDMYVYHHKKDKITDSVNNMEDISQDPQPKPILVGDDSSDISSAIVTAGSFIFFAFFLVVLLIIGFFYMIGSS